MGNAANAAALSELMLGDGETAAVWFARAADRWRESFADAPPGSWGRPIGAMKARILGGNWSGAQRDAQWALGEGAAAAESPIGRYAATLAFLVLEQWADARVAADYLRTHEGFPTDVADALAFIAADDPVGYAEAIDEVLESFEHRDAYLEDIPVADTVLVLQALAARRGIEPDLESALLPY